MSGALQPELNKLLREKWGFHTFRPLQREAIDAVLEGRESLVVLPTGGGKSLCFQAPALLMPGMALVVSPLISLMKDQVDALRHNGVAAACLHSGQESDEQRWIATECSAGNIKVLYVSPERLASEPFMQWLSRRKISFVAIDEAHCISQWGHDFRPEYRQLATLRRLMAGITFHAYTATATEEVRRDIVHQLDLRDAEVLVGSFDRHNLTYRVVPRSGLYDQVADVCARYGQDAGIVYCISRKQTEAMADALSKRGVTVRPYHAGLDPAVREANQNAFIRDEVRVIAATVAFGMGIDKPNVRFVIHAGPPQSLEHYQQESGRAGRDGLPSECMLVWSPRDLMVWRKIIFDGVAEDRVPILESKLDAVQRYCTAHKCRRRMLLEWFGEKYPRENCGACDVCTGGSVPMQDSLVVAQKILSCVVRLKESFGSAYVGRVLLESKDARIFEHGHDKLSTYGLLKHEERPIVKSWIEQLVMSGALEVQEETEALRVTAEGWEVLRGKRAPVLVRPAEGVVKRRRKGDQRQSSAVAEELSAREQELFERLRALRLEIAREEQSPAYIVFGDRTLIDMARRNPRNTREMMEVSGMGLKKMELYGERFLAELRKWRKDQA